MSLSKRFTTSQQYILVYFALVMTTYGSLYLKEIILWYTGSIIVFLTILNILQKGKIDKVLLNTVKVNSLWLIYVLFSSYGIISLELHLKAIFETLIYILFSAIIFYFFKSLQDLLRMIYYSMVPFIIVSLIVLLLLILGIDINNSDYAYASIYNNRNSYAMMTIIYLTIAVYTPEAYMNNFIKQSRPLFLIILILLTLLSLSTNGLLGIIILGLIYYLQKYNLRKAMLKISVFIVFIGLFYFAIPESYQRMINKVDALSAYNHDDMQSKRNSSAAIRLYLAINAYELFLEHPIKGVGVNNAQFYLRSPANILRGIDKNYNSENNYSEMLLNGGIVAFLLYYIPTIWLLFKLTRIKKKHIYKNLSNLVTSLLIIKLFSDIGLKSYNHLGHSIILVFSWMTYYRFIKNKSELLDAQ